MAGEVTLDDDDVEALVALLRRSGAEWVRLCGTTLLEFPSLEDYLAAAILTSGYRR